MDWSSFASVGTFDFDKLLAIVPGATSICHSNRKLESEQNKPVRSRTNNIRKQTTIYRKRNYHHAASDRAT
jgi:aspartate aminotransferase-like enzyme